MTPGARLDGRVALVTGATGGIGDAVSRRLAAEGAPVVVTDVDQQRCDALAAELATGRGTALGLALHVSDEDAWQAAAERVAEALGGLSVLVNNAGIAEPRWGGWAGPRRWRGRWRSWRRTTRASSPARSCTWTAAGRLADPREGPPCHGAALHAGREPRR